MSNAPEDYKAALQMALDGNAKLREEIERLREALREIAEKTDDSTAGNIAIRALTSQQRQGARNE